MKCICQTDGNPHHRDVLIGCPVHDKPPVMQEVDKALATWAKMVHPYGSAIFPELKAAFKAGYEAAKKKDGETVGKMIEVIEDTLNKCK